MLIKTKIEKFDKNQKHTKKLFNWLITGNIKGNFYFKNYNTKKEIKDYEDYEPIESKEIHKNLKISDIPF